MAILSGGSLLQIVSQEDERIYLLLRSDSHTPTLKMIKGLKPDWLGEYRDSKCFLMKDIRSAIGSLKAGDKEANVS